MLQTLNKQYAFGTSLLTMVTTNNEHMDSIL